MPAPYIDIHTHRHYAAADTLSFYAHQADGRAWPDDTFSAGVHPWDVGQATAEWLDALAEVPMIGEIGLDKRADASIEVQSQWLVRQMDIAERRQVPVIIHCRKAYNELAEILKPYTVPVILHNFIGSVDMADREFERCYLSFGKRLFGSPKSVAAMRHADVKRLFFETDNAMELSINQIYAEAAALRGMAVDDLREAVFDNFVRLFPMTYVGR